MFKISRPVLYTVLGALAVYAIVLVATPDAPPAAHHRQVIIETQASADADGGITDADRTAHFARVRPGKRDPFMPMVLPAGLQDSQADMTGGHWQLTGIYIVNGLSSALVENSATGDSLSLKTGDRWRGLRVAAIESDAVLFENALGQQTRLSFQEPSADGSGSPNRPMGGNGLPLGVSPLPPMPVTGILRPLPPLPTSGPTITSGRPTP